MPFSQRRINNKARKGSEHPFHACPRLTSRERLEYSIGDRWLHVTPAVGFSSWGFEGMAPS
jgi:hypothetical protein